MSCIIALNSRWSIYLRCISLSASWQIWPKKASLKLLTTYNTLKISYIKRKIYPHTKLYGKYLSSQWHTPRNVRTVPGTWNTQVMPNFRKWLQKTRLNRTIAEKLFLFAFDCKMLNSLLSDTKRITLMSMWDKK